MTLMRLITTDKAIPDCVFSSCSRYVHLSGETVVSKTPPGNKFFPSICENLLFLYNQCSVFMSEFRTHSPLVILRTNLYFGSASNDDPYHIHFLMLNFRILPAIIILVYYSAVAGDSPRTVRAVRTDVPPHIDGLLNDEVWKKELQAAGFTQRDPNEGQPASERTEISVLYDADALYFGCMFYDSEPDKIVARLTRRDNEIESDRGSIRIDSYHDHQTAYEFTFNAAGVKVDILQFDDADREDESWDVVWDLETRILPNGWSAELRIPFRVLRYQIDQADTGEVVWGINFFRHISRKNEDVRWVFTPKDESGFVSRFGHLAGLQNLPVPRQLEILPFVLAKQQNEPAQSYQERRREFQSDAGLDLKYGVSNNFVLDATINPDFGQVEADPAVLNLTTFETFYPEKRPFFIEGTQIIRFSTFGDDFGPGMFYSRRIGRAISVDEVAVPDGGRITSFPQSTSILGAAKLSGKTTGGLSVGVLQALTAEEKGTVVDSTGVSSEQVVEPFAHYNVLRLRQDVLENSNFGLIATSVAKEGRFPALTAGGDWNLRFESNTYQLSGFLALSRTTDDQNERVNGSAGKIEYARIAAEHWLWNVALDFTSKRYNINDVGFFFRPNDFGSVATISYKQNRPAELYRNYNAQLFLHERRNFDGVNLIRETRLEAHVLFSNYWSLGAGGTLDIGKLDDRETRGNGLYQRPHPYTAGIGIETDNRDPVIFELNQTFGWDTRLKRETRTEVDIEIKPLPWMEWGVESEYGRVRDFEAWVDNVTTGSGTASIFADRTTDEFGITLRSTLTFTKELTLQLYGQVFLAKGHFENFRQLVGTSAFVPYAYDENPDFNDQELNTNVVLRWEYLPGSTLFLVWSQAREGSNPNYFRGLSENFGDTFRVPPSNVFLLKVSYWLSV